MKQKEIIEKLTIDIQRNAYQARIHEHLHTINYDANMMDYHCNVSRGQAFEAISILNMMTGSNRGDDIYNRSESEAIDDIKRIEGLHGYTKSGYIALLDAAGFCGAEHYEVEAKYNPNLPA